MSLARERCPGFSCAKNFARSRTMRPVSSLMDRAKSRAVAAGSRPETMAWAKVSALALARQTKAGILMSICELISFKARCCAGLSSSASARRCIWRRRLSNSRGSPPGRSTATQSMEFQLLPYAILLATRVTSGAGEYVVVLELPRDFISALPVPWTYILTRLSLFLIGAALLCSWLAFKISTPLLRLRASTRAFASGDLAVRTGPSHGAPREIQDLSHDFDEMAGRIETLVDSQTRLLQYVSHELRTPLTRLNLSIEAARRGLSAPGPDMDRIETEAARLNALLQRILHLSRLQWTFLSATSGCERWRTTTRPAGASMVLTWRKSSRCDWHHFAPRNR